MNTIKSVAMRIVECLKPGGAVIKITMFNNILDFTTSKSAQFI
jgi:hypothetical protein